ncbi:alpha/beta hydrolase [Conyzicola nivalis]|uniref:2-hydroxy-6-oxo-6-phenylhexa-2,4-dienoate hydrolase n=1 Tax=Conyzicola nivalis TaxID=1477021 RepID=A0A916SMP4_9MICO|nr:alpha/beta hydrolase [Conyzicola nivalis]GGB06980.1 2-hydroxy-6-oxo-6-phenylhexa-2,4-dienoate hydrolase [Conyzicola nivalis]
MECRIGDVVVNYAEHGEGMPLVALHGAGVDHREIEAAVEAVLPRVGLRRIYPDLPGMGGTTADGIDSNDDVVALLAGFVDRIAGEPALLLGHSYGAYVARGVAAQHPEAVTGLALLCPIADGAEQVPVHRVVREEPGTYDELDAGQRADFDEYFVARTPAGARRYRDSVAPGVAAVDEAALGRIFAGWAVNVDGPVFDRPTLIVAGRSDSTAGHVHATGLLESYPRATLAVVADAGHALMHERPDLLAALLSDWCDAVAREHNR